jgi:hypothetical protein
MMSRLAIALLILTLSVSIFAAPAPWYKWRSKLDGREVCSQTSPGAGWEKMDAPYRDARCERPALPKNEF